jgi:alpha-galactosidase
MQNLSFKNIQFSAHAETVRRLRGGYLLEGAQVHIDLPETACRYYRHGWQSWSLTTWSEIGERLPVPKPHRLHPMQTDPLYTRHPAPNGSWVGAVELESNQILLLGALGLEAHTALHEKELHGWYEASGKAWFAAYGEEASVFTRYAQLLGERIGRTARYPTPRVWCSWYSLYTAIDESILYRVAEELNDLPFDVMQVDDGWQVAIGDWEPNVKFPTGMAALADRIRATGRTPGLWLAPLLAVPSSRLFQEHRNWLLRDPNGNLVSAGFLWGEPLYALDTSHQQVLDWLRNLMRKVRTWGYDYAKLDFIYAGALPGVRHVEMPRENAYRQGLRAMREGLGPDAYLLACGAPILPSLGLCDAMRIGPDVGGEWESYRDSVLLQNPSTPGVKNAIRTTVNRLWLAPLVAVDPDVVYFTSRRNSLSADYKCMLRDLALVCNFKASSDLPSWLTKSELDDLKAFLINEPTIERTGRNTFKLGSREIDFSSAMLTPREPRGFTALASEALGWIGNQNWALKLQDRLGRRALQKMRRELG